MGARDIKRGKSNHTPSSQQEVHNRMAGLCAEVRERAGQNGCGVRFSETIFKREIGRSERVHQVHQNTLGLDGFTGFGYSEMCQKH